MIRTSGGPLRRVWTAAYAVVARVAAIALARRLDAEVLLRGAGASGGWVPGLSDIDLVAVVPAGASLPDPPRVHRLGGLVQADVYRADDLAAILGSTARTFGLGTFRSAYHGHTVPIDRTGLLDRPGIPAESRSWRRLAGPRRVPPSPMSDRAALLDAAWCEVVTWWRFALEAVFAPGPAPSDAYLCVKLVAEPLRVLVLLDGGTVRGRDDALAQGARLVPGLVAQFEAARTLLGRLHERPPAPLAETMPVLLALSERVALRIAQELPRGASVHLEGSRVLLPAADWRAVVAEPLPGRRLVVSDGDAGRVDDLRRAAGAAGDDVAALPAGELVVQPTSDPWFAGRMRTLQAPFSDPVGHALLTGAGTAAFPAARGLAARDWARRAVAERSAWLAAAGARQPRVAPWRRPPDAAGSTAEVAGHLLGALRAALFALSVARDEPVLLLDAPAVAAAAGGAAAEVAAALGAGAAPAPQAVDALRDVVAAQLTRARDALAAA